MLNFFVINKLFSSLLVSVVSNHIVVLYHGGCFQNDKSVATGKAKTEREE